MPEIDLSGMFHTSTDPQSREWNRFRCALLKYDTGVITNETTPQDFRDCLHDPVKRIALSKVEVLNLRLCQMQFLPEEVMLLPELKELDLSENHLSKLPNMAPTEGTPLLERLDLYKNRLTTLPSSVASLQNLKVFCISNNDFEEIPASVMKIKGLCKLRLSSNPLTYLPDGFASSFLHLRELAITHANLQELPRDFGRLSSLLRLDLNDNELQSLPPSFVNLTKLQILMLSNNELTSIPSAINLFKFLSLINLDGNHFPSSVLQRKKE
ncbi:MAG: hypothetical protein P0S94_01265 [Simkaniaceae bacterium]|nr:hypothetical protein [Simkaniaceae bacterium]